MNEQIQDLINKLKAAGVNTQAFEKAFNDANRTIGDSEKLLSTLQTTLRGVTAGARGLNTEFSSMQDNLAAVLAEVSKTNSAVNQGAKGYRALTSIVSELAQEEEGIFKFTQKDLVARNQKAQIQLREIQLAGERLARENDMLTLSGGHLENAIQTRIEKGLINDKEAAIIRARANGYELERKAVELTSLRLQKEQQVEKSIGLTGTALSGVNTILGKLGLSGLSGEIDSITSKIKDNMRKEIEKTKQVFATGEGAAEYLELEKANKGLATQIEELQKKNDLTTEEESLLIKLTEERQKNVEAQEDLVAGGKAVVKTTYEELSLRSKINHLTKGAGEALTKAFDKIGDPGVIFAFIGKSLLEGSSRAAKLQKELTISKGAAEGLKNELALAANASMSNFITSEKLTKSFLEMSKYIGQSAHMLGGEALVSATYLTEKMHLSADAAGQLVTMTRLTGRNTEETFKGMGKTLTQFNLTNKTAFSLKDIMNDIGNMSKATVLTLGKSPTALLKAAAAARKLGVSMEQLESIGESLLDFESSIEKELEAQLLTGNSLNLSRARELAMMGDMEGLAKEIGNQEAIKNAFATKNVIAQKAAAEALGMSREELAKMTYQQELNNLGAENFKAKYGEVAYESAKAQSAQDKFNDALTKMQSILGDIIGAFSPIIDGVAYLVSIPVVPYIMAAAVASKALFGVGNPFAGMIKGIGAVRKGLSGYIKDVTSAKGIGGKVKSMLGLGDKTGGLTKDAAGRFRDAKGRFAKAPASATKKLSDSAKSMPKGAEGGAGGMKSLTDAISKIDPKKLLAGAAAMVVAAGAVFVFAKATQEFMEVSWSAVGKAIVSLAALVGAVVALGVLMSSGVGAVAILAGAAAMVVMAGALYILGKAMQEIGGGLSAIGEGVVNIGNTVTGEMIGLLYSLGPALASAAAGVGLFGLALAGGGIASFFGGGIMSDIQALANMAEPLATVGTSLTLIASGLAAISLALSTLETEKINELKGLVMTTAMAAPMVAATGAITDLISGIAGGGDEGSSNAALEAKLDELIAVVKQGGDVYIDGNKAGTAMMLAQYKTA